MIGKLPGTLSDRSIEVPLKRKLPDEKVKRFRIIRPGMLPDLNRMCIRWANDNLISLRDAATNVPDGLHDRAADNWEPLLAIADRAGEEWPERARKAALALSGRDASEDTSVGATLLGDIQAIFKRRAHDAENNSWWHELSSTALAEALAAMEGRLWAEWRQGKAITPNAVAKLLKPFGIEPKHDLGEKKNLRGYRIAQFVDAFARYARGEPSVTSENSESLKTKGNSENQSSEDGPAPELSNRRKGNEIRNSELSELLIPPETAREYGPPTEWEIEL